jgi:uncharacterized protein (TIGR02231 family)
MHETRMGDTMSRTASRNRIAPRAIGTPTISALLQTGFLAGGSLLAGNILLAATSAEAAVIEGKSAISNIVLYPDAAIVTRELTIDLPAGEHEVLLADLPATLDPASLRVEGMAESPVVIGNVDLRLRANIPESDKPETQRRLRALRAERGRIQDRVDAVQGKKAMIQRLAENPGGKDGKALDMESWSRAWDLVGKGLQAVQEELRTLSEDQARIDAEIATLEGGPEVRGNRGRDAARVAAIALEATSATKLSLSVKYRVGGAAWRPVYDARLDTRSVTPALELTRRAMIRQSTGEDWSDARITLSTLSVTRGTAAPVLQGEKIALYEPPMPKPMMVGRTAPASAPAPMAEAREKANDALKMRATTEEAVATIDAGAYQTEFLVPGKISIPSGRAEKSVRLGTEMPETSLVVRAAPVLNPTAFLELSFKQGGEVPLLPGEVLLSRDGAFIGRGHLPLVVPGEKAKLGFGSDDRVKVTRIPVSRQAREPGLLSSTKTDEMSFRTTITNLHPFPVKVEIEDRVPISEEQAIVVERMGEMTRPDVEAPDDRRGVFLWTPMLKPREEKTFMTAYRIKWPADKRTQIQPLPR